MSNSANINKMVAAVRRARQQFKMRETEGTSLFGSDSPKKDVQPGPDAQLRMIDDFTRAQESFTAIDRKLKAARQNAAMLATEVQQSGPPMRAQASELKHAYQGLDQLRQKRDAAHNIFKGHRSVLQKTGIPLSDLDQAKTGLQNQSAQIKAKKQEQRQKRADSLSAFGSGSLEFAKAGFNIGKKILTTGYEQSLKQNDAAIQDKLKPDAATANSAIPLLPQRPVAAAQGSSSAGGNLQVIQSSYQILNGTNIRRSLVQEDANGNAADTPTVPQTRIVSGLQPLQSSYQTLSGADILRARRPENGDRNALGQVIDRGSNAVSELQIIQSSTQVLNTAGSLSARGQEGEDAETNPATGLTAPASPQGNNLGADLQALQEAWQGLSLDIYTQHESSLRSLTQTATSYVSQIREWGQNNQGLVRTFGLIATAVTGITGTIGAVASAVAPFITGLGTLISIATTVGSVFTTVFGGIMTVIGALTLPVIAVIAAFAAAALAIYTFWEPISAFFGGVIDGIKIAFAPIADLFTPFKPVFDGIGNVISYVKDRFNDLISPINFSKETLENCANAGKFFGQTLIEALTLPLTPLRKLMEGIDWVLEKLHIIDENKNIIVNKSEEAPPSAGAVFGLSTINNLNNYQAAKPTAGHIYTDNRQTEYNITLNGDVSPGSDNRRYFEDLFSKNKYDEHNNALSKFSLTGGIPA